ncbi:hypothetical protein LIQ25_12020 [Blautia glucerasea]|uniref:hypothetical protein n=1 Tax=Blautia TaxID=572511 RepID=UPI00156FAF38|nr:MULTISPECIES: hypothetical protein [Blautia]MCB5383170.1 hypothetical protein [Blautia glucerasea]NSJ70981.1 hypothetical protein [Blautia faecis]
MPDNKDELLKQQNEEIQKLKKELKAATKPSSMLSVLKSAVRRNVHDFFIREDKIKSVQEENKKLKKELEETKEERDKTSAQLFAAINLGSDNQEQTSFEEGGTPDDTCDTPVFPQTAEEAVREYFGPVDLAALARQLYPDQSMQHQNPEPESSAPPKIKDAPIIQEQPDSSVKNEKKPDDNIVCEPGPSDSTLHTGSNPRSKSGNEGVKPALSKEKSIKQDLSDNPPSELEDGPMQEDINEAPFEDDLPDLTELPEDLPDISGGSVWDMEEPPTEPQAEPEAIQVEHTEEPADESLKKSLKEFPKEPPKKTQKKPTKESSLSLTKAEEKPKQTLKSQEKKIEKSDSGQKTTEKQDAAEQQNQPEKIKEKQTEPPKSKPQQNENPTATVIDKNGKKKSKKDKRKTQQQRQEPEIKQEPPKIIPMEQPPKEVELPDDFGIVMEPEEPEPIELPDPNENNRNIFDEIFNSDSDNWDDSNI